MEPHETSAGQKCSKEPREKNLLQRQWVSEPSTGTKRSIYTEGVGEAGITDSVKPRLSGECQTSSESQFFAQVLLRSKLPQSYPQQPMQKPFLTGTKPQPGLERHAWPFPGQLQSLPTDDMFSVHSRSHGAFPHQKSPSLPSAFGQYSQSSSESKEEGHKKEQKPKKPGKYICQYCGRACAKPSVLKKHIRSHTGERPYPCEPCGFSFKTKSNLYKHRKSHAHAIKAGLVPFSEIAARADIDQASSIGEAEVHSDGDQSTDTDEETAERAMYPEKSGSVPQISFESEKSTLDKRGEPAYADSADLTLANMKVPILIVPKPGFPSTAIECMPFTEIKGSHIGGHIARGDESHTIKQRLALRLTEKKSQDSEPSQNLLSPHSKGSTDSGYFSRSESAEQQISPPNTNAKSYEEIMFGRSWYYRPNSRSRHAIGMTTTAISNPQIKSSMRELEIGNMSDDHIFIKGVSIKSQMVAGSDTTQYPKGSLLEAPSDSGPLIRSNSMPTPSPTNLNVPSALKGSLSFDEMMSPDDVFYPGASGLRRLRRQAAFEHGESENYGKTTSPFSTIKVGERGQLIPEFKGSGSELACPEIRTSYGACSTKVGMSEMTTRKRRKEKSVGDEEDCLVQYEGIQSGSSETAVEYDLKQGSQEGSRATPTGRGSMYSGYSSSESFDKGTVMGQEEVLTQDPDRKAVNVISVIQHTNLLSRPSSFEKSESIDHPSYQPEKASSQLSEQSDTENIDDVQSPDSILRSESMEHQQQSDSELSSISHSQQYHMPHKLVRQPNIQVPEIRVTEEPDKPEKEPEVPAKEPDKPVEEFQWPQRSETLSQLPAEKLPPKKKRLRLADIEHSSGESSFESTCTSLSRSPSQESNLSHSSSFSMSFDREESIKSVSPTKQDEFGKQSEFLTVPGSGNSLSIPGHHQKEMRRSSSEQAPCALPTEALENRSKSFDYGSLSPTSRQGEVYASASSMKERRRGYLVRQASLSVYPEAVPQEQVSEINIKQELSEPHISPSVWQGNSNVSSVSHSTAGSDLGWPKRGSYNLLQQSISEDSQSEDFQKSPRLPGQLSSDSEASVHEHMGQDVMQHPSHHSSLVSSAFLPFQTMVWHSESTRNKQQQTFYQLQKPHIRMPNVQPMLEKSHKPLHQMQAQNDLKGDGASQDYPYFSRASSQNLSSCLSKVFTTNSAFLQQVQPVFATQNLGSQPSLPGMQVPVRIQTNVPSYGSVMYTSVSQIIATHAQSTNSVRLICSNNTSTSSLSGISSNHPVMLNLSKILGHPEGSSQYSLWKIPESLPGRLNTGIPLSLTSGTISTTDASSSLGGSKRMLSPASSLELFIGTKQQKRVKEENMYGQIVKELSAVELSNSSAPSDSDTSPQTNPLNDSDDQERMSSSPPANYPSAILSVNPSASHLPDTPPKDSFTPPLQIVPNSSKRSESPEEFDVDKSTPEDSSSPQSMISSSDAHDELNTTMSSKIPVNMLVRLAASHSTLLLTDLADVEQFFQFPSLRSTTTVSWCYLNYTKPNYAQTSPLSSVYGSWSVSSFNPNPLSLSTKATLALLRSKQRKNTETYTVANMYQQGTGKLVSSLLWKQKFEQMKPELMQLDVGKFGRKMKGITPKDKGKEEHGEKEASSKQAEPTRIKIFEGGFKSNEDYVYVRGRGRGKYICEECGIRCKKPSMLKKHIRTHTDVRPYVCKFCNFAFKTKGNLTKHMKSKAHMKKCLELGVSVTCVDDVEAEETGSTADVQRDTGKISMLSMTEHQFSDAEDSDGPEEDGDEVDEDEEDEDDYDGDLTPKTRSRSTSPHPYVIPSHSVTADASLQMGPVPKQPLFGYYNSLPSIQITQLMVPNEKAKEGQMSENQKLRDAFGEEYKNRLEMSGSMDEDPGLSPGHSLSSFDFSPSRLSSPGCDSSPLREPSPTFRRFLSPIRDLSPRGRLSPRRETSPLRPLSPKRDIYRRDLSPRKDLSSRRELSPRSRPKGIIRPLSPRRPPYPHSGPWTPNIHVDMPTMTQKRRSHLEMEMDKMKSCYTQGDVYSPEDSCTSQGLFSHLPLHSQQQTYTPFPMIPIGGIQVVPGLALPTRFPFTKSTSEESSEASFSYSEVCEANSNHGAKYLNQSQESSRAVCSDLSLSSQRPREDSKVIKQEESIQTCTKAIASLHIASEEPIEKPIEPYHQHTFSHSSITQQESAIDSIQHFSSSEVKHPLHSSTETGASITTKTPTECHPTVYSTGAPKQDPSEKPSSAKRRNELTKDTTDR
ncbi:transcription factor HIVEP2a [Trichomycterus rosablanca]|uniref:transcription factor HIVEP2a n=1 Tax=Trichomycterus rosablanca TaxID=2290929 RepID=UPI002F358A90